MNREDTGNDRAAGGRGEGAERRGGATIQSEHAKCHVRRGRAGESGGGGERRGKEIGGNVDVQAVQNQTGKGEGGTEKQERGKGTDYAGL